MVSLTVRLFGRFGVWNEHQQPVGLNVRRAREVFSYLLLHPDRPHRREKLADLLWQDAPPAQARKYLRQALWQIQAVAQREHGDANAFPMEVDPEWVQLHGFGRLHVDVRSFQDAISHCHGIPGPRLDGVQRQLLEDAVHLYHGDLLEGWEQDWCLAERERLLNALLEALDKLVTCCVARHDSERGLAHARRMLMVDPAREQVHTHIMRLHALAGNRTEALRAYQSCERLLMQELGVKPSEATQALHASLREGRSDSPLLEPRQVDIALLDGAPYGPCLDRLPALADHLSRVRSTLAHIEARLRREYSPSDSGAPGT